METKFKNGPWFVGYGSGLSGDVISWTCLLESEDDYNEVVVRSGHEAVCIIPHSRDSDYHKANAHLISAAPDLYEALERLLGCLDSMHNDPEVLNAFGCHYDLDDLSDAAEALRKARGEQ